MLNFWPFQSGGSKTGVACGIVGSEELKSAPLPRENDPRWKVGGKVAKINIYPVKSLTGISVHNAVVEKHGLRHGAIMDRQFMIIDQNGKFVTGRQYSRLVMVKVKIEGKSIILDGPGMDRITVAFPAAEFDNDEDSIVTTNVNKSYFSECFANNSRNHSQRIFAVSVLAKSAFSGHLTRKLAEQKL
jgi:hypothetical protein